MKRLCIYITYDAYGIVHNYIGYMLAELKRNCDFLAVVCNCKSISIGMENIEPYADATFFRENIGLDAGAYKEALNLFIGWDVVYQYDELVLVNDSFFGPVYPLRKSFELMSGVDADFWGMTGSRGGFDKKLGAYDKHIQSYFIVFRHRTFHSSQFRSFFENLELPENYHEAIVRFELQLNKVLADGGFRGISQMDLFPFGQDVHENENPYMMYPLELIRDCHIPILKRKVFSMSDIHGNGMAALRYIEENTNYDVSYINNYLDAIQGNKDNGKLHYQELEAFYRIHKRVFIYGAGVCGKNIATYFEYRGWNFAGYIVSKNEGQDNCIEIVQINIEESDGIIIAVTRKDVCDEILKRISDKCNESQVFMLDYGETA